MQVEFLALNALSVLGANSGEGIVSVFLKLGGEREGNSSTLDID